jgi:hypothetical protein
VPKKAHEKAQKICEKLNLPANGFAYIVIKRAIKDQDRDTRHACAEAVAAIPGETGDDLIDAGLAHDACINAIAV